MTSQEDIWLSGEGDKWFERNFWKLGDVDPVFPLVMKYLKPSNYSHLMEIGCANGWRLNELREAWGRRGLRLECHGVDPSMTAIRNGAARWGDINLHIGTAIAFPPGTSGIINCLIYGFCLYVCDPQDHFEIATQGNMLLAEDGLLIIHDFDPDTPHSVPNHHVDGMMTYKMGWSQLWLCHPSYVLLEKQAFPDGTAVWVLQKQSNEKAFPCSSASSASVPSETDTPET